MMTGIGAVAVRQPCVPDREADATDPIASRFSPPYMRRSAAALLGKRAAGLSATTGRPEARLARRARRRGKAQSID